jgi:hypothetical protein
MHGNTAVGLNSYMSHFLFGSDEPILSLRKLSIAFWEFITNHKKLSILIQEQKGS